MAEILNESDFSDKVINADGKIMVEFFATWCPHCQRMAPIVDEFANMVKGKTKVYQVDIDKSPALADEYAPNGVPTFTVFENGNEVGATSGEQTIQELTAFVGAA